MANGENVILVNRGTLVAEVMRVADELNIGSDPNALVFVGDSISDFDAPTDDGTLGILTLGDDQLEVRWDDTASKWVSEPRPMISWHDSWILAVRDDLGANQLSYLFQPKGTSGQIGQSNFGWNPYSIRNADLAFAAGLTLQEKLTAGFWTWDGGSDYYLATVLYPFNDGESISGLIVPADYLGSEISGVATRRVLSSTGWVDSQTQSAGGKHSLMPHVYGAYNTIAPGGSSVEYFFAEYRWRS